MGCPSASFVIDFDAGLDIFDINIEMNLVAANRFTLHLNTAGKQVVTFEHWSYLVPNVMFVTPAEIVGNLVFIFQHAWRVE